MTLFVSREFQGTFQKVGSFELNGNQKKLFSYHESYLANPSAHALSQSLPLQPDPYTSNDYQGFFEGLLPESTMRTELARSFHLSPSDYLGLLEHLGSECIGALVFHSSDEEIENPHYEAFNNDELGQIRQQPGSLSFNITQTTRLSLAGAQTKFGVYIDPENSSTEPEAWFKPLGSAPSTHIVKIADERFADLPHNEHACMLLAQACRLDVAETSVPETLPRTLVIKRFDRDFTHASRNIDGHLAPLRLHQEDFAQAQGWPPYYKYEIADVLFARIAGRLITRASSDAIVDRRIFAQQTVFAYLIGNCDNHLKNHTLVYSPSWESVRISPAYDIVCTTVLGFDKKMGFSIGNHIVIDEITPDDWALFADDIQLGEGEIEIIIREIISAFPSAVEMVEKTLDGDVKVQLDKIVEDAAPRLKVLENET